MNDSPNWTDRQQEINELDEKVNVIQYQVEQIDVDLSNVAKTNEANTFTNTQTMPSAVINNTLTFNQSLLTGVYTSFNAGSYDTIDDEKVATAKAVIDLIYPIGSIYITMNDIPGEKLFDSNDKPYVMWLGCKWQAFINNSFLRSSSIARVGLDSWEWTDGGQTGGSATHTISIYEMPVHNHGLGTMGYIDSNVMSGSSVTVAAMPLPQPISTDYTGGLNGETQPFSILPPYQNVYTYFRIE